MPKKVTSIDFVFENCEVGTLPMKAVPLFYLDNVNKSISHCWNFESDPADQVETTISCKYARFQVDYELAKKIGTNFMDVFDDDIEQNNLAKRLLNWNNLTYITLNYQNGTTLDIYVPFDELQINELDVNNRVQTAKLVEYNAWDVGFNEAYKGHDMIVVEVGKRADDENN